MGRPAPRTAAELLGRIHERGYSYPEIADMLGGGDPSYLRQVVAGKKGKGGGQKYLGELDRIWQRIKRRTNPRAARLDVDELAPEADWTRTTHADTARADASTAARGMVGYSRNIRGRARRGWQAAIDCVFNAVGAGVVPGPNRGQPRKNGRSEPDSRLPVVAKGSPAARWVATWRGEAGDIVRMMPRGKDLTDTVLRLMEDAGVISGTRADARKQLHSVEFRLWEESA